MNITEEIESSTIADSDVATTTLFSELMQRLVEKSHIYDAVDFYSQVSLETSSDISRFHQDSSKHCR